MHRSRSTPDPIAKLSTVKPSSRSDEPSSRPHGTTTAGRQAARVWNCAGLWDAGGSRETALRLGLLCATTAAAAFIQDFGILAALIGCLALTNGLVLPPVIDLRLRAWRMRGAPFRQTD